MADQILARVQNVSAGDSYTVSVFDLFGGASREVTGSPFYLNAGDMSAQFTVYLDTAGNGTIRCVDPGGNLLRPDALLPNNDNNTVTFPA